MPLPRKKRAPRIPEPPGENSGLEEEGSILGSVLPATIPDAAEFAPLDDREIEVMGAVGGEPVATDDVVKDIDETVEPIEAEIVSDADAQIVLAAAAEDSALTDEERQRLAALEQEIKESFYRAGAALREIHAQRLYRETHKTFEDYCLNALGYKRAYSYELVDAATMFDNLQKRLRAADILPTSAYQLRPLKKFKDDPKKQVEAWRRAVKKAEGRQPTYEAVKEVVAELLPGEMANTPGNPPKQEQWKHEPTKIIRVPEQFTEELLKIARFLDNGGSLSEIGDLENL